MGLRFLLLANSRRFDFVPFSYFSGQTADGGETVAVADPLQGPLLFASEEEAGVALCAPARPPSPSSAMPWRAPAYSTPLTAQASQVLTPG